MKHAVIVALVLIGGVPNAHADNDVYNTTTKYARSDAELHAASASCAQGFGAPDNGTQTSPQFKQCMLWHGWRFSLEDGQWLDSPKSKLRIGAYPVRVEGDETWLSHRVVDELFLMVREALRNAYTHAAASLVDMAYSADRSRVGGRISVKGSRPWER